MLKWSRIVDDSKSLGCSILGCPVLVKIELPKSGLVRFSDPHCTSLNMTKLNLKFKGPPMKSNWYNHESARSNV